MKTTWYYRWLDALSYKLLIPLALLLALAPFNPEPHLVETTGMLVRGELTEPVYIFDFFMHGAGLFILALKVGADIRRRNAPADVPASDVEPP
ncbi:hypothetical protein DV096_07470 [Bradymonadaceae bacterium TMQ3]|uniref:RND transporter n=1 Tax=Lujinxingia sediminis TaxID=2480984 RepID=A0ABY0CTM5_9DELT|nr:hypothetical protein [Lujinxingia sediminis]RDV38641.1 hypothetical protein DV096_07470 [Bradymonadaceae bacterium TMQ3]RVU44808.1 hypothetical protein EA187_09720 [Lujinxingia sediminis]TXC76587.1 hypothetical protein FRC91_07600 [Bradymonadales bacterium TMQ1]